MRLKIQGRIVHEEFAKFFGKGFAKKHPGGGGEELRF
jgi:hypothetical protein